MARSTKRLAYIGASAAAALCLTTAGAAVAAGSAAQDTMYTPGCPGLGDPYFPREGNGGYDVSHYDVNLTYFPKSRHLGGTVTITATATQNLSRFDLDFRNFKVHTVTVNGAGASYTRDSHELIITPDSGLDKGTEFTVAVKYDGRPHTITHSPIIFGSPYGWIYTPDGAFVGCEPNAASTWYPSNDHPSDKATFTFDITVPKGIEVVANGDLKDQFSKGNTSTFVWDETSPMATYLATIDIGKWVFHQTKTPGGIPEFVGVDKDLEAQAEGSHIIELTGDITDYYSKIFGRYAFSSTGAIIDNVQNVGFSLETQTRPLYGFVPDSGTASHELGHEWYGDSLSVKTWDNIWLNEGFATFVSWVWTEHTGGSSTYDTATRVFNSISADDPFWNQSIADPQRNTMFASAVYYRGAMTLASLRHKIGDKKFFDLMKTWATTHRYGNVTTSEFTALAEKISGKNLDGFFKTWLWDKTKPDHI
jgi:aminopeptidase N